MVDGYFSSTDMVSGPEDAMSSPALASLSLACRESRTAVLELYPTVLKVFQRRWHKLRTSIESRLVRCRPETDTLVIYAVPDKSLTLNQSTEASWRLRNEGRMNIFPNNERQFSGFKEIITSFQHVAISFSADVPEFDGNGNQAQTLDDVQPDNDSIALLFFFKSLKHLYFWVDPLSWRYARWRDGERSNNIEDIEPIMPGAILYGLGIEALRTESLKFLNDYNLGVRTQNAHSVANNAHWAPQPKLLEHIGYCFPEFWFMMMRLKACRFPDLSFDAATTEKYKNNWVEYGSRMFLS